MSGENKQDVELNDSVDDVIEMAHDPEKAEKQSEDSASKAEDAVKKKAPARKGDKSNGESMEKGPSKPMEDVDVDAELNQIMEEEATLSESFKEKTATLFETALKAKLRDEVARLEEEYQEELSAEKEAFKESMVEKIDGFLNYVVENWMEENKVAVERGIRNEIAEDFIAGLKTLFEESYIEVPESKVDLVDSLAERVEELEEQYNEVTELAIALNEENETFLKERIINECSGDLAETQREKFASLVEDLEFNDEETYRKKLETVKESHFTKKKASTSSITEEEGGSLEESTRELTNEMQAYVNALKKLN